MPVPTNRNKILPARGNYSDLDSNKASLLDGEICYAIDQDQYYQKEGSVLVAVGATKAQGTKADTAVQPGANISVFTNNAGYLTNASLEISNADDVNITSIEEDQVLLWDGSDFVNGSAPVMVEVKNTTGSTISKGAAVYVSGTHTSGKPLISLADNDGSNTYPAIGLAHKDIANGDEGYVTVSGTLFNINTSFSGWSAGDALYLSDTPGALTNTRPTTTAQKVQKVALVTRVHATAGSVIVIGAGRTNDIPNDLVTLTGVSLGDSTLGTFTGTTISDNESIKDALQTLETAVENASAPSNVLTTTTTFSGDVSGTYNNISIDDGPGSGLDADTVDGLQATSFLRANESDTFEGNGASDRKLTFRCIDGQTGADAGSSKFPLEVFQNSNTTGSDAAMAFHINGNYGAYFGLDRATSDLFVGGWSKGANKYKIWHAGNDGTGSGLDADTLDGLSEGDFLRRNATTTFNCNGNNLVFDFDTAGRASLQFSLNGTAQWNISHTNSGADLNFDRVAGSGQVTIENQKVFYGGNDGAGSGLDADTLDGIDSGSFLRSDAADTTNSDLTISKNGSPTFTVRTSAGSAQDAKIKIGGARTSCNTCNISMLEFTNEVTSAYTMAQISAMDPSANSDSNNGKLVFRTSNAGTLEDRLVIPATTGDPSYNGNKLFHAGNDGAASGLDADTLDGQQGSYYLDYNNFTNTPTIGSGSFDGLTGKTSGTGDYSTSGDLVSGRGSGGAALTVNDGGGNANVTFNHQNATPEQNGNAGRMRVNTDSTSGARFRFDLKSNVTSGSQVALTEVFTMTESGATCLGNTVWHAGSDGAGSGLDADTLDGVQGANFLRSNVDDTFTGDITGETLLLGGGQIVSSEAKLQVNGFMRTGNIIIHEGGNSPTSNNKTISNISGELHFDGQKVWYADNDGSGSSLDADTVDGLEASSFIRSNADDTANRRIVFSACATENHDDMATSTGQLGSLEIRNSDSGNDAFMAFHTSNDYAFYLGLDADSNSLAVGGWSLGNNKYKIWHAGNDGAGSGLDADTVDGLAAASFLRSNADDSFSGALTGSGTILTTGSFMGITGNGGGVILTTNDGGGNANLCFNHQNAVPDQNGSSGRIRVSVDATNATMDLQVGDNVTGGTTKTLATALSLTTSTASFYGNTAWHAGNDGAGSGLDADTVDGLASTSFLRSDANDTTTGNITIRRANPNLLLEGTGTTTGNYPTLRFNTGNNQGVMIEHNEFDGELPIAGYGLIVTGDDDNGQFPSTGTLSFSVLGNIYAGATSVSNLSRVLTTADEGAFNGLDADMVDGIDASGFLRSNAYDQYDGQTAGRRIRFRCVDDRNAGSSNGNLFPLEVYQDSNGTNSDAAMAFHISNGFATYFGLNRATNDLFVGGWSNTTNKFRIWHAGNDGAGSGLDADTLDGLAGASFLRSNANDTATGQITLSGGLSTNGEDVYLSNGALISNDSGGAFSNRSGSNIDHVWHSDGTNTWHFCSDNTYKANGNSTVRAGSFSAAGNTVWHAGNDGAGSGLDADTIDGYSSGSLLKSNEFDEKTSGSLRFNDSVKLLLGSGGDCELFHDGTNTYIKNSTGALFLRNDGGFFIQDKGGNENHLRTVDNAQVELYYNGSKKLNTTGAGVEINSSLEIIHSSTPFIDFKNNANDDFDSRILANPNALKFYTGGNGNTAEHFQIASNGDLTATDTTIGSNSDSRLKTNVSDFTYSLEDFKQYQPKTFDWRNPELHGNKTGQRGFIAQDVEAIDDYWVDEQEIDEDSADAQFLDEDRLVKTLKLGKKDAMYVSVIQQALAKIEALETTVSNLQARVTQLETT